MKPFQAQFTGALARDGKPSRSFDVAARRFADGAFQACVRVPSACGSTVHAVEVSPQQARMVRELMRDTGSTLRQVLQAQSKGRDVVGWFDVVGHTYDLVGAVAPRVAAPVVNGAQYRFDLVGDLQSTLRGALGSVSNPMGAAQGVGVGALGGLLSGGAQGAAEGALGAIGSAMGLDPSQARAIAQRLAGGPGVPASVAEWQQRRDRALTELGAVVRAGTHPLGSDNWRGALNFHMGNGGITVPEHGALLRDQSVLASLPIVSPMLTDPALIAALQADGKLPTPWPPEATPRAARADLAGAMARATGSNALDASIRTPSTLVGVATSQSMPNVSAQQAGAALGASEVLARALASIALERGSSNAAVQDAARVASAALRSADAIAGARAGDPRARAALRAALNQSSDRLARAMRVSLALVGEG